MGCTEPVAVSLCTAKAVELLGTEPERIEALLSPNVLKNAMGVGIPGTGMIGLPIAIALGAIVGKSEYQLEVLKDTTPEAVARGREWIDQGRIGVGLKEGGCDILYIEVKASAQGHTATAIISGAHTNFVYMSKDQGVLADSRTPVEGGAECKDIELNLRMVWDYATTSPVEELEYILQARDLNKAVAEESLRGEWGHCLGRTLRSKTNLAMMGDSTFAHILSYTSAACDARMGGAQMPVMSNSGSGNQGISATLPVVIYAEEKGHNHEQLVRALTLSQAELGASVGLVRMRGCLDGLELRHHLPDGRWLRRGGYGGEEYGCHTDGYGLRRSQAELCIEGVERRFDGHYVGRYGNGAPRRYGLGGRD